MQNHHHWVWAADGFWLFKAGALDFAGGTVVHINAGVAGLVAAYMLGKRAGLGRESNGTAQPYAHCDWRKLNLQVGLALTVVVL